MLSKLLMLKSFLAEKKYSQYVLKAGEFLTQAGQVLQDIEEGRVFDEDLEACDVCAGECIAELTRVAAADSTEFVDPVTLLIIAQAVRAIVQFIRERRKR